MGNLSFDVTREELIEAFSAAGRVVDAKVPTDRETGRPRGFAFVEFESEDAVRKCIDTMHGREFKGRALRINEAENRPPRPPGSVPGGFSRPPGGGFSRPPGGGFSRPPGGGYRPNASGGGFPPTFEPEGEGGPGRRFRQKPPSRKPSPKRRRKDDIVDDDDSY